MVYVKKKHKLILLAAVIGCIFIYISRSRDVSANLNKHANIDTNLRSSPLNFSSIDYTLNSNICLYKKPRIIILITSHIENESARGAIRQSYPRELFRQHNAQIVFLLAEREKRHQIPINKEFQQFNDIVQGNFTEAYRNLTYKHLMGLHWCQLYCSSVKYVVKMDDDIVINYYVLFGIINRFKSKFHLMGHTIENMRPIRNISNKWYVSEEEYSENIYPSFLSGWMYIATSKAVKLLLQQVHMTNYFWIDDVFITGILRKSTELRLTDIKKYFRYEPENVKCCIKNKYSCDFVAAPSGKDYEFNKHLNDHLWECRYKKSCHLESSVKTSCLFSDNYIPTKGYYLQGSF